jgi:hypothetical protein
VLPRGDVCDGSIARSEELTEYGVSKKACAHKVCQAIKNCILCIIGIYHDAQSFECQIFR